MNLITVGDKSTTNIFFLHGGQLLMLCYVQKAGHENLFKDRMVPIVHFNNKNDYINEAH